MLDFMVEKPSRYFFRSMALSVAGALVIAAITLQIDGGAEDAGLLFFMSFLAGFFYTLLLCPMAYIMAKGLIRMRSPAWQETAAVLLAGGALCLAVVTTLIWLGNGSEEPSGLKESLGVASVFLAGWLVYAVGMQLAAPE